MAERDAKGRFSKGWKGGPGRPTRTTEATYVLTISEHVTPDVWKSIVKRAVQDAQNGDATARAWLTRYLVGDAPPTLTSLVVAERAGLTIEDQIEASAGKLSAEAHLTRFRSQLHKLLRSSETSPGEHQ